MYLLNLMWAKVRPDIIYITNQYLSTAHSLISFNHQPLAVEKWTGKIPALFLSLSLSFSLCVMFEVWLFLAHFFHHSQDGFSALDFCVDFGNNFAAKCRREFAGEFCGRRRCPEPAVAGQSHSVPKLLWRWNGPWRFGRGRRATHVRSAGSRRYAARFLEAAVSEECYTLPVRPGHRAGLSERPRCPVELPQYGGGRWDGRAGPRASGGGTAAGRGAAAPPRALLAGHSAAYVCSGRSRVYRRPAATGPEQDLPRCEPGLRTASDGGVAGGMAPLAALQWHGDFHKWAGLRGERWISIEKQLTHLSSFYKKKNWKNRFDGSNCFIKPNWSLTNVHQCVKIFSGVFLRLPLPNLFSHRKIFVEQNFTAASGNR